MKNKVGFLLGLGIVVLGLTGCGKKQNIQVCMGQDSVDAQSLGYQPDALGENAFVITRAGDSVYLLASTEQGRARADAYLKHHLTDARGQVTLKPGERYVDLGTYVKEAITIGETPIDSYTIAYTAKAAKDACEKLQYYILQTGNVVLEIQPEKKAGGDTILLSVDQTLEAGAKEIAIREGQVVITASDEETLEQAVYLFANTYLGWMKAGTEAEKISSTTTKIHIPDEVEEQPAWMEEREATIVLWNINYNRGFYLNGDTALENNIMDMSEEQLYEYVKMLKFCGFTGIQLTEMCSAWAGVGGYEAVHEKIRMMADAAHSLDMQVTLWVWGAEFNGYGWVDESVTYDKEDYDFAYQNPKVVETFEKYFSIYAQLADCCDRLVGHFYDPGNLHTAEDIAYFCNMLRDKFYAVNPEIDFGISCWVDVFDKNVFVRELGNDVTLYECGHHDEESDYQKFRGFVAGSGCRLGTWAWNTCEMEIDQLAQMNFNLDLIRSIYQTARKYDGIIKPGYWSEMDSYHILNVFSLYCAGQMLMNPDIESEVLLGQITEAAVGEEYAEAFGEMLLILQDARSGTSWDNFFWSKEDYLLKSDSYPAEDLLERCNRMIPVLDEMIEKEIETNTLPLPISLNQVLRMMRPHLCQIRDFAKFRIELAQLEALVEEGTGMEGTAVKEGTDLEAVAEKLYEIGQPIDSYNCIIGTWGQIEARAQRELVLEFCDKTGVAAPIYEEYDKQRKDFIYAQFAMYQRGKQEPNEIGEPYYQYGVAFGEEETKRLVEEMIEDGLLLRTERDTVYLADWENYRYHFN